MTVLRTFALLGLAWSASQAAAFCGFYVGKADSSLFNEASQVILVRDGSRTVISMANDYKGELTEFALVVPVPTVLQKSQINVGERAIFDRLDAYSAPRLAEYFDEDPCSRRIAYAARGSSDSPPAPQSPAPAAKLGVTIEAQYQIGEYDILILSATQSDGLETWLKANGYRLPNGASAALKPYILQGMKFFVAKVNIKEQSKTGFTRLRPLQFAFESEKFMLPMRLGMLNAAGTQDLIVYALTRHGRVESSNYRTQKLPANMELPTFIRPDFTKFYKALFDRAAKRENYKVVWTEYFWDMSWCDPCAANPLSKDELRKAGVFWVDPSSGSHAPNSPSNALPRRPPTDAAAQPVMLSRLHLRYTAESFPEDLMLQETKDRANFQTRYVVRHPWKGDPRACEAATQYYDQLGKRLEREVQNLATLTDWDINDLRAKMDTSIPTAPSKPIGQWWENLWRTR